VAFVELGLSADSDYGDRVPELRSRTFLTNSDAHSPYPVRLGREFNRLEVRGHGFDEVRKAILGIEGRRITLNVGLPPAQGKYNRTACIKCHGRVALRDAELQRWRCARCGGRLKKGVFDRVLELSGGERTDHPASRPPYLHLIPLGEIIAIALGYSSHNTRIGGRVWDTLISRFGSELKVLLDVPLDEIADLDTTPEEVSGGFDWIVLAAALRAFRNGRIVVHPGGGGHYGKIALPHTDVGSTDGPGRDGPGGTGDTGDGGSSGDQSTLFDFQP